MQLPYISLEQHNTGKRGHYFSSLNYPEDPIHAELTLEKMGPGRWAGNPHLDTVHGGPWPGTGLEDGGWTAAQELVLCSSQGPIHLSLWIISPYTCAREAASSIARIPSVLCCGMKHKYHFLPARAFTGPA